MKPLTRYFEKIILCISKIVKAIIHWGALTAFLITFLTASFWLLYPYETIVVKKPIKILNYNKTVKAGDDLLYEIEYEKFIDVPCVISRKLANTFLIPYADTIGTAPVGKGIARVVLPTPENANEGIYHLRWSVTYPANPLRDITLTVKSEEFRMVK